MSDEGDHEVGYRKPPVGHRFQPGVSGNKRGRPKKKKALHVDEVILKVAARQVTVRTANRSEEMPLIEVIITKMAEDAMKGCQRSRANFVKLTGKADAQRRSDFHREVERLDSSACQLSFLAAAYERAGLAFPEEDIWSHPSDVVVDREGLRIDKLGAQTGPELALQKRFVAIRDKLLKELEQFDSFESSEEAHTDDVVSLLLQIEDLQQRLPPRLRVSIYTVGWKRSSNPVHTLKARDELITRAEALGAETDLLEQEEITLRAMLAVIGHLHWTLPEEMSREPEIAFVL